MLNHPTRRLRARALLTVAVLAFWSGPGLAHKAHVDGLARLDVSLQGRELSVALEMPLESLVGFERAPRNALEREQVDKALAQLRVPGVLRPDGAAQCTLRGVEIEVPPVLSQPAAAAVQAVEHADVQARWVFDCTRPQALGTLVVGLFDAFARLQRIEVQMALPSGQRKSLLRPSLRVLRLSS